MSKANIFTNFVNTGKNIVTRVAPSPTGTPHIGTAYIGLMNYLYAKKHNGKFILRIEDTDQIRSKHLYEKDIIKALKWVGLSWDEGPDIGGPNGPYRQSERGEIYKPFTDKLLESGKVFPCFCTSHRLEQLRAEQTAKRMSSGYDGHCLHLSPSQQKQMMASTPFVLRQKIPESGYCEFNDLIKGNTRIPWSSIDMQVLMKSDKMPTYHLANVLDDHLMGVSHVIRGEEWVSSTPKHLLLYDYLGLQPPLFAHLPLLRNEDMSKLSKRKSATSILWFENEGYLPEAVLNYLGLFAIPTRQSDKFTLQQLLDNFELQNITGSAPIFDIKKLHSLNSQWIRESYTSQQFSKLYKEWAFEKEGRLEKALILAQSRSTTLGETSKLISPIINTMVEIQTSDFDKIKISKDNVLKLFYIASKAIDRIESWDKPTIENLMSHLSSTLDIKKGVLTKPFYIAITGNDTGLPLFETMCILGKEASKTRLTNAIKVLGGVSQEMQRDLEKIDLNALASKDNVTNKQSLPQAEKKNNKPNNDDDDPPSSSSEGNSANQSPNEHHSTKHNNSTPQKLSSVVVLLGALQDSILSLAGHLGLISTDLSVSLYEQRLIEEFLQQEKAKYECETGTEGSNKANRNLETVETVEVGKEAKVEFTSLIAGKTDPVILNWILSSSGALTKRTLQVEQKEGQSDTIGVSLEQGTAKDSSSLNTEQHESEVLMDEEWEQTKNSTTEEVVAEELAEVHLEDGELESMNAVWSQVEDGQSALQTSQTTEGGGIEKTKAENVLTERPATEPIDQLSGPQQSMAPQLQQSNMGREEIDPRYEEERVLTDRMRTEQQEAPVPQSQQNSIRMAAVTISPNEIASSFNFFMKWLAGESTCGGGIPTSTAWSSGALEILQGVRLIPTDSLGRPIRDSRDFMEAIESEFKALNGPLTDQRLSPELPSSTLFEGIKLSDIGTPGWSWIQQFRDEVDLSGKGE